MRSRHLLFLCGFVVFGLVVSTAVAQNNFPNGNHFKINGVPPSVTSFGFGGHPGFFGVPPSVTSINFGVAPNAVAFRHPHGEFGHGFRHHNQVFVLPYYAGGYYIPYEYPAYIGEPMVDDSGPYDAVAPEQTSAADSLQHDITSLKSTVNDFRDELRSARTEPRNESQVPAAPQSQSQPVADQPKTVLVFKDGHQSTVMNYAIVGSTLYDLSDGRTKKVALAELDLPATVKQNDDRGVEFRLPAGVRAN
ncbi:MAG TPA: hypothetical protein VFM77_12185 [Terriglobales bacterium]|nr:hypothetical protein [Terriglobales bacterium]